MKKHIPLFLGILLVSAPTYTNAECIGCMTPHIEQLPNGETAEFYIKKCMAKQKHLEGETCPFCKCSKAAHSLHKHPYKMHHNKKVSELPIETILPAEQTKEEKNAAIKEFLLTGMLPSQTHAKQKGQ